MKKREADALAEKALIRLKNGDSQALDDIYDLYGRMIFSVSLGITGNYSDSEDILQETMLGVLKYSTSYKSGTSPSAFVMAIARHKAIDTLRKRKNELSIDDPSLCTLESDESIEEREKDISLDVFKLLSYLSEDDRQLILLHVYCEMSFFDVAKAMDISVFAARKRYQRILEKLKKYSGGL